MKHKGRWVHRELKVHWYCINCSQKGIAGISINSITNESPTVTDIKKCVEMTCHTRCDKPEIRLHYDVKSQFPTIN